MNHLKMHFQLEQVSHKQKTSYFPLYWLFSRDPYFMVYKNPHLTQCSISFPTNPLNNQVAFFIAHMFPTVVFMYKLEDLPLKPNVYPEIIHLIGFSIINHQFWDTTIFGNTQCI